jgi:hypothetical protein
MSVGKGMPTRVDMYSSALIYTGPVFYILALCFWQVRPVMQPSARLALYVHYAQELLATYHTDGVILFQRRYPERMGCEDETERK